MAPTYQRGLGGLPQQGPHPAAFFLPFKTLTEELRRTARGTTPVPAETLNGAHALEALSMRPKVLSPALRPPFSHGQQLPSTRALTFEMPPRLSSAHLSSAPVYKDFRAAATPGRG